MSKRSPWYPQGKGSPYVRMLGKIAGLAIKVVRGQLVRDDLFMDFTQGGNEAIYPTFVPPGEIWVEDGVNGHDKAATILHEMIERDQMMRNGLPYVKAHDIALSFEKIFRKQVLAKRPQRGVDLKAIATAYRQYQRAAD